MDGTQSPPHSDTATPAPPPGLVYGLLLPLFFLSGATALTYQSLWVRELQLVFGTSTFAISTVLSAFMAGLAAGGFVMGRYADRIARPLRAYGLLEIGIGLYTVLFPFIVAAITPVYLGVWRALQPGPALFGVIQFVLVGSTLLLPTALMGATLPLLARFATHRLGAAGDRIGTLYSVNTLGAVLGTAVCGFLLLPGIGRFDTTWLAAGANVALGLAAVGLDAWSRGGKPRVEDDLPVHPPAAEALPVVAVSIGLAGFSALVYEVAWTRIAGLMLGASVYSFTVMLLAFLVGIAVGGKIGGPLADRWLRTGGLKRVLYAFAAIEIAIAVVSYALMYVYPELPFWYVWIFDALDALDRPEAVWMVSLAVAGLVMTPPAVLMGVHFPVAVRAVVGSEDQLGGPVGVVYGANTLGGVAGAFLAGFVLLPGVGVQWTVFAAAVAEFAAAGLLLWWAERREGLRYTFGAPIGLAAMLLVFLGAGPPWDPMLMTAGMYHYVSHFSDHSREGIESFSVGVYELKYYEEGLSSVVTVAKNTESDNIWLANNGKVDASTTTDMPTQVLCSLLPVQYVEDPKDVLVIGLASGITAGALSQVGSIEREDVVELEPAIQRAALFFGAYNHNILDNDKVNIIVNDGRNHVLLTPERTYDIIVSEPSNPWISGVSNLFTREFLEIGKTRLKPGGVWSQWVQLYGMGEQDVKTLLRTFAEVYPYVQLYATIEDADLVLIGSESPIAPTVAYAERLFRWPAVVDELGEVDVSSPTEVVALWQMDRAEILELAGDAKLNTDDNMTIEYNAPMSLHLDTQQSNMEMMLGHSQIPFAYVEKTPEVYAELARAYHARDDDGRAIPTMLAAANLLPEGTPERQALVDEAAEWKRALDAEYGPR